MRHDLLVYLGQHERQRHAPVGMRGVGVYEGAQGGGHGNGFLGRRQYGAKGVGW